MDYIYAAAIAVAIIWAAWTWYEDRKQDRAMEEFFRLRTEELESRIAAAKERHPATAAKKASAAKAPAKKAPAKKAAPAKAPARKAAPAKKAPAKKATTKRTK